MLLVNSLKIRKTVYLESYCAINVKNFKTIQVYKSILNILSPSQSVS